jgi:serine protease Do
VPHPEEHVVRIRRGAQRLGLGVVVGSGRVLTALSSLGNGRELTAVFSDGQQQAVSVLRSHRGSDLALLDVDDANFSRRGLELSVGGQRSRSLGFSGTQAKVARLDGTATPRVYGADAVEIKGAWVARSPLFLGTPIVDDQGRVSSITVLGCVARDGAAADAGCRERDVVLPTTLVQAFLSGVEAPDSVGWLGAGVETYDTGWLRGLRIVSVETGSPAQSAKLQPSHDGQEGDLVVALNGVPVSSPWGLYQTVMGMPPGTDAELLVLRGGVFRLVTTKIGAQSGARDSLEPSPPLVQATTRWFGY